ncbi:hypothetical protein BU24DRAFT_417153 [Aaosphaeria arxii CBS 175.79]|uniref:Uncharacterized protein n=1 Tax=Aaosphaeria arxii CBS 175.79 TaxID=1450172 RepID=A0A6A5Y7H0_9PLEO|nr:uncharacterized protein BU24DRAFT_417153 [Aaosphaeria arxii CBS 175.79]KAF2021515.1 hypothetical protein BU24DRAFT_417153 [Aaosphaeria arxii CBS 175.79]
MAAVQSHASPAILIPSGRTDRLSPGPEAIPSQRTPQVHMPAASYGASSPGSIHTNLSGSAGSNSSSSIANAPCPPALEPRSQAPYPSSPNGASSTQPNLNTLQADTPLAMPRGPYSSLNHPDALSQPQIPSTSPQPGLAASYYDKSNISLPDISVTSSRPIDPAELPANLAGDGGLAGDRGLFSSSPNSKSDKYVKKGAEFVKKQVRKKIEKKMNGGGGGGSGKVWGDIGDAIGQYGEDGNNQGGQGDYGAQGSGGGDYGYGDASGGGADYGAQGSGGGDYGYGDASGGGGDYGFGTGDYGYGEGDYGMSGGDFGEIDFGGVGEAIEGGGGGEGLGEAIAAIFGG